MTLRVTLPAARYDTDEKIRAFSRDLFERVERLPDMQAVGSVGYLPMSNTGVGEHFEIEDRPPVPPDGDRPSSWISTAGGRYFEAMGIRLVRGRFPRHSDTERTQAVFVIDEELARKYWPNQDPIGARLIWRRDGEVRLAGEVIGIVGGVRWAGRANSAQPTDVLLVSAESGPRAQHRRARGWRAGAPGRSHRSPGTRDRSQSAGGRGACDGTISSRTTSRGPDSRCSSLGAFASAALLLAAIGLYGVIAFWVTQRTREIGVRVALGAEYADVLKLVMRRGMLLIGAGLAIGAAATLAFGRVLSGLLHGIRPSDPVTLVAAALVLAGVAMIATYVPARRAATVDPLLALKCE